MDNYGEELAYWYLRLNGFFPIPNFVLHSVEINDGSEKFYNADADIIAIRPPNVSEMIGTETVKFDEKIVTAEEGSEYLFVYCEVKTGGYRNNELFPAGRVKYVKDRCGFPLDFDEKSNVKNRIFKRVLIANSKQNGLSDNVTYISINDTLSFILNRFKEYDEYKYPSRMFFKSSLIQLLIHVAKEDPQGLRHEVLLPRGDLFNK
jgi:hypothetical protein